MERRLITRIPSAYLWHHQLVCSDGDSQGSSPSLPLISVNFRDRRRPFALSLLLHPTGRSWEMPISLASRIRLIPHNYPWRGDHEQLSRNFECSLEHSCEINCCTSQVLWSYCGREETPTHLLLNDEMSTHPRVGGMLSWSVNSSRGRGVEDIFNVVLQWIPCPPSAPHHGLLQVRLFRIPGQLESNAVSSLGDLRKSASLGVGSA